MQTRSFKIEAEKTIKGVFYSDSLGVPYIFGNSPTPDNKLLRVSYQLSADDPDVRFEQSVKLVADDSPKMDLWKRSKGITQQVDYVVQPHFPIGFKDHLRIRMAERPPLGQLIQFRPTGSTYTIIQVVDNLPANNIRYVLLDRPLEEAVTAVSTIFEDGAFGEACWHFGYVVEQWFDTGMFDNGGVIWGGALDDFKVLMLN